MSGETARQPSGYTLDTLKEYVDAKLQAAAELSLAHKESIEDSVGSLKETLTASMKSAEEAVKTALATSKEAVNKAELAAEKRFDSVNEFRGQLKDQQATLLPRGEADARFKAIEDKLDVLKGSSSAGAASLWSIVLGAIGGLLGIISTVALIVHFARP